MSYQENRDIYICLPMEKIVMNIMFRDAYGMEDVKILEYPYNLNTDRARFCYKVLKKIEQYSKIDLTKRYRHISNSSLLNCGMSKERESIVIFLNPSTKYLTKELVEELRKRYHVKLLLCFLDPVEGFNSIDARKKISWFDGVYTFDQKDAELYGFQYFFQVYSKLDRERHNQIIKDLYFAGWGGKANRKVLLIQLAEQMRDKNLQWDFHLTSKKFDKNIRDITYHKKPISYESVIDGVLMSNCILDIMQETQHGATLKYLEAICYNKKLLTNNPNIYSFPYFNEKYMRIYRKVSDIDWNWVSQRETVNYGYAGDFSPIRLINRIMNEF